MAGLDSNSSATATSAEAVTATGEGSSIPSDLVDVLGVIKFPAWVEAADGSSLYYNGRLLGSVMFGEDSRRQVSGQIVGSGALGGVVALRQKNGVQRMLDAVIYPLFMPSRGIPEQDAVRIVVICDFAESAERDRDVSLALWGKLFRGNALEEEASLSPQQRRIYRLLLRKMTYKEMASELGVAHSTVRVQVAGIRKVLGSSKVPVLRRSLDKPV